MRLDGGRTVSNLKGLKMGQTIRSVQRKLIYLTARSENYDLLSLLK